MRRIERSIVDCDWKRALMLLAYGVVLMTVVAWSPSQPSNPTIYSGTVSMGGGEAPNGLEIFAIVGDWQSERVKASGGKYQGLIVGPASSYIGRPITFHATFGGTVVQGAQTENFSGNLTIKSLNLSFAETPGPAYTPTPVPTVAGEPTYTPTPAPTSTASPTATPTATVVPTATPRATATPTASLPIPGDPAMREIPKLGLLLGAGLLVAGGASLLVMRRRLA